MSPATREDRKIVTLCVLTMIVWAVRVGSPWGAASYGWSMALHRQSATAPVFLAWFLVAVLFNLVIWPVWSRMMDERLS